MTTTRLILVFLLALPALALAEVGVPKMVLGWLETTQLKGSAMRIKTKLDPGAKTSSMQATNIEYFRRDENTWVHFDFTDIDVDSEEQQILHLEGPLVREVEIKRHGAESVVRPVITHEFCLYNQIYRTEFSLTDRSNFNYTILLGRSFLSEVALVDSSKMFLSRPTCEGNTSVRDIAE